MRRRAQRVTNQAAQDAADEALRETTKAAQDVADETLRADCHTAMEASRLLGERCDAAARRLADWRRDMEQRRVQLICSGRRQAAATTRAGAERAAVEVEAGAAALRAALAALQAGLAAEEQQADGC